MVDQDQLQVLLLKAKTILEKNAVENPLQEARILLEDTCGLPIAKQLAKPDLTLDKKQKNAFWQAVKQRSQRVPRAYISGKSCFYGREFYVDHVLIPRPETELLIDAVLELEHLPEEIFLLDLCTGSGCVGISLYLELLEQYKVNLSLTDLSLHAIKTCRQNVLELVPKPEGVMLFHTDLFPPKESNQKYNLFVANPPYIESQTIHSLEAEVKDYEPHMALDGGTDGLNFYRRIAREIKFYMLANQESYLFLEHGMGQRQAIKEIFNQSGLEILKTMVFDDYQKIDRILAFALKIQ